MSENVGATSWVEVSVQHKMPKQATLSKFFTKGATTGPYVKKPPVNTGTPPPVKTPSPEPEDASVPGPSANQGDLDSKKDTQKQKRIAWLRSISKATLRDTLNRLKTGYRDKSTSSYPAATTNALGCVLAIKSPNRTVS